MRRRRSPLVPPPPPPPVIDFGGACGNTGATQKGCGGAQDHPGPAHAEQPGPDSHRVPDHEHAHLQQLRHRPRPSWRRCLSNGVRGVWKTPDHTTPSQNDCSAPVGSGCAGGIANGNVLVPAGTSARRTGSSPRNWAPPAISGRGSRGGCLTRPVAPSSLSVWRGRKIGHLAPELQRVAEAYQNGSTRSATPAPAPGQHERRLPRRAGRAACAAARARRRRRAS